MEAAEQNLLVRPLTGDALVADATDPAAPLQATSSKTLDALERILNGLFGGDRNWLT